jgi:hypothetical protein
LQVSCVRRAVINRGGDVELQTWRTGLECFPAPHSTYQRSLLRRAACLKRFHQMSNTANDPRDPNRQRSRLIARTKAHKCPKLLCQWLFRLMGKSHHVTDRATSTAPISNDQQPAKLTSNTAPVLCTSTKDTEFIGAHTFACHVDRELMYVRIVIVHKGQLTKPLSTQQNSQTYPS